MQRRNALFLLLAIGVAAAVFVALRAHDDAPSPVTPVTPPGDGPIPVSPPHADPPGPAAAQDPVPIPAGVPLVRVAVTARERFAPMPVPGAAAVRAGDRVLLPTVLLAGTGAGFDTTARQSGTALASIDLGTGVVLRQVAIAADAIAHPVVGAPMVVRGKVLGGDRKPVPGTRVWFGEFDANGARRDAGLDDDGNYELPVPAGDGVPFVVSAPGHATQWRALTVGAGTVQDATLARGCVLEVQLAALAVAMTQARAYVLPRAGVGTALAQWPFFAQTLADGYGFDANGRVTIDDLPPGGEVSLVVRHPRCLQPVAQMVTLKGDRVRALVPLAFAATTWSGQVVDEQGAPLPGVAVWARADAGALAASPSQRFVPPHAETAGAFARSDENGAFEVAVPPGAHAVLSLRAIGRAGRDLAWSALGKAPIALPAQAGGECELRLSPPQPAVAWHVQCDLGAGLHDAVAPDQTWRVSLPHPGVFDVRLVTTVDGKPRGEALHAAVPVAGPLELRAPWQP